MYLNVTTEEKVKPELKLGRMTTKEIAEWFGISYGSFKNSSAKKYEILQYYCKYTKVYGGIIVEEIYISQCLNKDSTFNKVKTKTKEKWIKNEPETIARVADKIRQEDEITHELNITGSTYNHYVSLARKELWGKATPTTIGIGEIGRSKKILAKMWRGERPAENIYKPIEESDKEIYNSIHDQYFPQIDREKIDLIFLDIKEKKITLKEGTTQISKYYSDLFSNINYPAYIKAMSEALGCDWMVSATLVEDGQIFVDKEEEQQAEQMYIEAN